MAGGGDESHGKRKREEGSERKAKAARFSKARQERLEQEFAETYGGLTALYKLLEIKQLQSPLLLPRTLSYRLPRATKGAEKKLKKPAKATARRDPPVSGAVMRDVKLGLTSDLLETLKNENHRLGLRLAIYSADGSEFADNLFTLVAECTIPGERLILCICWIVYHRSDWEVSEQFPGSRKSASLQRYCRSTPILSS